MQNYSDVFAAVLAECQSPYVPGDQGDAGKGQVCVRAGERIHRTLNANVGYISKTAGQTQFYGVAVDALLDKSDGTGADYLTDILQPDGRRLIALAFTAYAPPPPGSPLPPSNWVAPTAVYLDYPGPLVFGAPPPEPTPTPPPDSSDTAAILDAVAAVASTLDDMRAQAAADTAAIRADVAGVLDYIKHLEHSIEDTLTKAGIIYVHRKRKGDAAP